MKAILLGLFFMAGTLHLAGQVSIGNGPLAPAHPSAVLELISTAKGLLIPRLDSAQQSALTGPANGLLVYNTSLRSLQYYDSLSGTWQRAGSTLGDPALDSLHWQTDTAAKRVYLRRGLALGDSIFYKYDTRQFLFADKVEYINSVGQVFPVTNFFAKHLFKQTASQRADTAQVGTFSNVFAITEADERYARNTGFIGVQGVAVSNKNNQRTLNRLVGILGNVIHAADDSLFFLRGGEASATLSGNGYVNTITGHNVIVNLLDSARTNVGTVYGTRTQVLKENGTFKVGTLYGHGIFLFNVDTLANSVVSGDAYGLFINTVNMAGPGRNYAIRTFTGANVLGDSTFIGPGGVRPRATLEVGGSGAMIIPSGTIAQRPATALTGMFRYNSQLNGVEHYDGTQWRGIVRTTVGIDVPSIAASGGQTVVVALTGARLDGAVSISPSSSSAMPAGLSIAWARVSANDQIEVHFQNQSATVALDPPLLNFAVRVVN
jgi:hypothetical protein